MTEKETGSGKFNVDIEAGVLELQDDEGNLERFYIETDIELDGKKYLILCHEDEVDLDEYIALRIEKDEEGEEYLVTIEDDQELAKLQAALDNLGLDEE